MGKKWTPAQHAKFRETVAAKKAERANTMKAFALHGTSQKIADVVIQRAHGGEMGLAQAKLDTVNRLVDLIQQILRSDNA